MRIVFHKKPQLVSHLSGAQKSTDDHCYCYCLVVLAL